MACLGEPHFVETDGFAHGGPWYFWDFEADDGLRFSVFYSDSFKAANAASDPPDAERLIALLKSLGIPGPYESYADSRKPWKELIDGCVWLVFGHGAVMPTGAFSTKARAEEWIAKERFSGTLVPYLVDRPPLRYRSNWRTAPHLTHEERQAYVGEIGERYEYENGSLIAGYETWLLCRQDDNGVRAVVKEFQFHAEAVAALREFERTLHKQMYWIEPKPLSGTAVGDYYRVLNEDPSVPRGGPH